MKPPRPQYAVGPEGRVAYQVLGEGPLDLLFVPFVGRNNLDIIWENPQLERWHRRLASFSRLIVMNFRGSGISDPLPESERNILEDWADDIRAVLDAVGSTRAAIFAIETTGPAPLLFAATYPERTQALVLLDTVANWIRQDDYPWGMPAEVMDQFVRVLVDQWGTGQNLDFMAPELARDERFREWFGRIERLSLSPRMIELLNRAYLAWDVRGVLGSIRAPTLVIAHTNVHWIRLAHGRYLGEHLPNVKYLERDAEWNGIYWMSDADWTLDEVQAFLTGTRGAYVSDDRVLATVLFTDIVGSTQRAAELGDDRWRMLLDEHDAVVRREIERFRGRAVKSTGDGILATFDGPARGIRCALALRESVRELGVEVRTGLHTGEVEQRGEDVGGIAVHIGARVMQEAGPGEVLVSGSIPPLVQGSGIEFVDRGVRALKGVPGEWRLFMVQS